VQLLLEKMNERIEILLDRDHHLGHAYFMGLTSDSTLSALKGIFEKQILPLLQEYFFEDWQRIHWVLNDHRKAEAHRFVVESSSKVDSAFGSGDGLPVESRRWRVEPKAFEEVESYVGIIEVTLGA
jgi:5-methylcytosine-specific restriction enzyme B